MVRPVPVLPSPKFHAYDTIVPSTSLAALASNDAVRNVRLVVKPADGGGGGSTLTLWVDVDVAPPLSVTVSVTEYVPPDAYTCCVAMPVPVVPSPKFHAYDTIVPSSTSNDALASTYAFRYC